MTYECNVRCVNMLARLWHAPLGPDERTSVHDDGSTGSVRPNNHRLIPHPPISHLGGTGTATVGSSEAIMLAVLAMKWKWRAKRIKEGKPHDKPNLVMGSNAQICWKKVRSCVDATMRYRAATVGA